PPRDQALRRTRIDTLAGAFDALAPAVRAARDDQRGGGVEPHGVTIGARGAVQQRAERGGIIGGIAAAQRGDAVADQPRILGDDAVFSGAAAADPDHAAGAG